MSGALGALGGGIGFGAGKGFQWAAKTKVGETIMVRATKHASMIPIGQHLAQGAVGSVSGAATGSLSGAATGGLGSLATGGDVWQGIRQGAWNGAKDAELSADWRAAQPHPSHRPPSHSMERNTPQRSPEPQLGLQTGEPGQCSPYRRERQDFAPTWWRRA
ncbi:hypothetical protein AIF0345_0463 [Actinomyces israelii]|nr:hypothetical protein AIF0345_0463 [Actinomyces israelii]